MSGLILGLIGGLVAAAATVLGATPFLVKNQKLIDSLKRINMDFMIGVMLFSSALSLIYPAYNRSGEYFEVTLALILGVIFIRLIAILAERVFRDREKSINSKTLIFIIAMMAHNLPEGLAAGASMAMETTEHGYSLLSAITFQNIPEGLTTALSFISMGLSPVKAFAANFFTALIELSGGMIGGYLSVQIEGALPSLMAFAGGAMANVTIIEMVQRVKESSYYFFFKPGFITGALTVLVVSQI